MPFPSTFIGSPFDIRDSPSVLSVVNPPVRGPRTVRTGPEVAQAFIILTDDLLCQRNSGLVVLAVLDRSFPT
jgi:hypothetical protein